MEFSGYPDHQSAVNWYAFFLVNVCIVLFIAAIYGFAYRFLRERFYLIVGLGWLINAVYLALETYGKFFNKSVTIDSNHVFEYSTITISLISTLIFHYAIASEKEFNYGLKYIKNFYPVFGYIPIALCIVGIFYPFGADASTQATLFTVVIVLTILYSFAILGILAIRFFIVFPAEDYGLSSWFLFGSWGVYALLQLTYFLIPFGGQSSKPLIDLLFATGLILKVLNIIGLLNVLQREYFILQTEIHESSVLKDLGDMAAGLHHDLLEPVAMIDTDLFVLKQERGGDASVKKFLTSIETPLEMINAATSFIDLVRLDPETVAQEFKKIHIKTPVEIAISFYRKRFPNSSLRIIYKTDKIPSLHISANEILLAEHSFVNIIKNASEASARNIEIEVRRSRAQSGYIDFLFFNDGNNISKEEIKNCFKAGWSSKTQKAEKGNVGMGLYMCSKVVHMHRGEIEIFNLVAPFEGEFNRHFLSKYIVAVRVTLPITRRK